MHTYFRARREYLRLTQRQIAKELDLSTQAVSAWDRGDAFPGPQHWDGLAAVFRVKPETIAKEILKAARAASGAVQQPEPSVA